MKTLLRPLLMLLAGLFILGARQVEELQAAALGNTRAPQPKALHLQPMVLVNNSAPAPSKSTAPTPPPRTASLGDKYSTVSF